MPENGKVFLIFFRKRIENDEVSADSVGGVLPRNEDFFKIFASKPYSNVT
jgi:hypothetical protein